MALINCPHCGAKISDKATQCPKCGADSKQRVEENHIAEENKSVEDDSTQQNQEEYAKPSTKKAWPKVFSILMVVALVVGAICVYLFTQRDKQSTSNEKGEKDNVVNITPSFVEAVHQFDELYPFSDGMAAVKKGGKFGYINTKGKLVIPCQFDIACAFSNGLAIIMDDEYNIKILDMDGNVKSTPHKLDVPYYGTGGWHYDKGYYDIRFINNECIIKTVDSEDTIVIDANGTILTHPSEDSQLASMTNPTDTISNNPILVRFSVLKENMYHNEEEYYGIKDSSNKILVQPQYYHISDFHNGVAQVVIFIGQAETKGVPYGFHMPDGKYFFGYIDTKGNTTFTQSDFEKIEAYKNEQLKVSPMALDVKSLIKRTGNDVSVRDDWESQLLGMGFIKGDTEKYIYEGDDEEASLNGNREITRYSNYYFYNKLDNDIELIYEIDYEETFIISFVNRNTMNKFVESLKEFGYSEHLNDGKRVFSSFKDNNCPSIYWIVEENRIYSGNSNC